ncbi:MAG: formate dehydrogenase accessory protein FdhE [Desulfobacterales bacterium]|nr:formate dehydrogenase accessory protein FdhE [Desulfobacterales bacterium]
MTSTPAQNSSRVQAAVDRLRDQRPAYQEILTFYGPLFVEQEIRAAAMPPVELDPVAPKMTRIKQEEGFPLFSMTDFPVDPNAGADLFQWICDNAGGLSGPLAEDVAVFQRAVSDRRLHLPELFTALLTGDDDRIQETAEELSVDREILALVAYHSLRPAIVAFSRSLTDQGKVPESWQRGICPVCGGFPALCLLEEEGRRTLVCGFCWHQWRYRRVACPFCQTTDSKNLHYFYDENEPESRVDLCDACRRYLKTVDTRKTERALYPPLEVLTTLHLDIKAQDLGFKGELKPRS